MQNPHNQNPGTDHSPFPAVSDVTAVILAGGRSRRMGRDKATLELEGSTLFTRARTMLEGIFSRIIIAGDRPDLASAVIPSYPDIYQGSALGGIHNGLKNASTPWIFVTPCDLAFPDANLVKALLHHRVTNTDCVILRTPGGFEPVFALYHKNCLPVMETMLKTGNYRIFDFYPQVRARYLDAKQLPNNWQRSLCNLNSPDDLKRLAEGALM